MKTVLRDADGVGAEILVALGRSKSADDVNLGVRAANGSGSIRYNIENPRIVVMHFSRAVIAQEMVELRKSLGNIGIAVAIHDVQMFPGMGVVKPQVAILNGWCGTGYRGKGENRKQGKDANSQNVYIWIFNRADASSLAAPASFGARLLGDFAQIWRTLASRDYVSPSIAVA